MCSLFKKNQFFICLIFLLGVAVFSSNSSFAEKGEEKTYYFEHKDWVDDIKIKDNKLCRRNNDCADVEFLDEGTTLKVKWEKYPAEIFKLNSTGKIWTLKQEKLSIQDEYEEFVYSFEEPYIKLNPYGRTPLSALLKFPTDEETKISIRIKGKGETPDIVHEFDGYRTEHEIPIHGLFPNYKNKVVIRAKNKKGVSKKSEVEIVTGNPTFASYWAPIVKKDKNFHYYATYDGTVYDELGNIRYQFDTTGWHLTYFYKNHVYIEHQKVVSKYTLLGELLQRYVYPEGFYGYMHGLGFKDNGNLLIHGSVEGATAIFDGGEFESHRDIVLELDAQTGEELARYDLAEMLNPDRSLIVKSAEKNVGKVDWAHTNGIDYDAKNKAVIVSGRHFGIVKIDEASQKPIWWLTPHQLTHKSGRKGDKGDISHLLLTAVDKNGKPYSTAVQQGVEKAKGFKWPLKTHNVKYVGNGVYSIFDNSGDMYDKKLYTTKNSVASIFKIDDKKKTVQQVFLKELPHYSEMGSSVIVHPKTKQYWVMASNVINSNHTKMKDGHIQRFDKDGKELYHAVLHLETNGWVYLVQPYEFYSDKNWPTPQE